MCCILLNDVTDLYTRRRTLLLIVYTMEDLKSNDYADYQHR